MKSFPRNNSFRKNIHYNQKRNDFRRNPQNVSDNRGLNNQFNLRSYILERKPFFGFLSGILGFLFLVFGMIFVLQKFMILGFFLMILGFSFGIVAIFFSYTEMLKIRNLDKRYSPVSTEKGSKKNILTTLGLIEGICVIILGFILFFISGVASIWFAFFD